MARVRVSVYKDKKGQAVIVINKDRRRTQLDVSDCCLIGDAVDKFLFKQPTKRRIPHKDYDDVIQPMSKEEMHDLLYDINYLDGTDFTKAMSIKLVSLIDTNKIKKYGELFTIYHSALKLQ